MPPAAPRVPSAAPACVVGADPATEAVLRFLLGELGWAARALSATEAGGDGPPAGRDWPGVLVAVVDHAAEGRALLAALYRRYPGVPLVVLARHADLALRRHAFALGARDVIGWPAHPREVHARLRAAVPAPDRPRGSRHGDETLCAGGLTLRMATREVADRAGRRVRLARREAALLAALLRAAGRVVGEQELLDDVWGEDYVGTDAVLAVTIGRLRAKLAELADGTIAVRTQRGAGYALVSAAGEAASAS